MKKSDEKRVRAWIESSRRFVIANKTSIVVAYLILVAVFLGELLFVWQAEEIRFAHEWLLLLFGLPMLGMFTLQFLLLLEGWFDKPEPSVATLGLASLFVFWTFLCIGILAGFVWQIFAQSP